MKARMVKLVKSKQFYSVILFLICLYCGQNLFAGRIKVHNPYESVDWEEILLYDANFHTHTRLSDGRYDPHQVIDMYHKLGYRILALTDHDSFHHYAWPRTLYPWTEITGVFDAIQDQVSQRWSRGLEHGRTWREAANEPWENRDPNKMNMVAIEGSEISRTHHIGSFFSDYAGATPSEKTAFEEIGARNGLAIFYHPGRYDKDVQWYVDFYGAYDHLIGMEVYNRKDSHPEDRARWDNVLYQLMPERPVWGFANDDMHGDGDLGWNRNVFPLKKLNAVTVRKAMEQGAFYFYKPYEQGAAPSLAVSRITVLDTGIKLAVSGNYTKINWLTFNPNADQTEVIYTGNTLPFDLLPSYVKFVRAEIIGENGKLYTQPFGVYSE